VGHKFNKTDFIVMALGNIVGSGIFLASSAVISSAGAWAPLAYLLGGLIMMMEVSFIIEMSIAKPVPGAFKAHAQEIFGEWWGFVNGWMFWTSAVLGMSSEITACAIFTRLWLPDVPLWLLSLFFAILITIINLNDLKGLSKAEVVLAATKISAIVIFVIVGGLVVLGFPIGGVSANLQQYSAALSAPLEGVSGLLGAMLIVLYAYTGTGIIGLAATETHQAEKAVPSATRFVTVTVVGLYSLAVFLIIALLPAESLRPDTSPFVSILNIFKIPYAGSVLNFILLTAALSSLNSQVYSASRMLFSMAKSNQAPKAVGRQNAKGVPVAAVWMSGLVLLLTALMSYILPEKLYLYTICASGVLALVNWLSVSATHYFFRKKLLAEHPEKLKYKAPFYPYLSWICFFSVLMALLSAPLYPDQIPGLYSGSILLLLISIVYFFIPRKNK
jgi:L-asparagine transporter-like permease